MKFIKLLLLVTFSFVSVGLNSLMAHAGGLGYGYGECQAPYSRLDGTVGCGDEDDSTSSENHCAYTASGASVCEEEPAIETRPMEPGLIHDPIGQAIPSLGIGAVVEGARGVITGIIGEAIIHGAESQLHTDSTPESSPASGN